MRWLTKLGMISLVVLIAGCGAFGGNKDGAKSRSATNNAPPVRPERDFGNTITFDDSGETIWDAFRKGDAEQTVHLVPIILPPVLCCVVLLSVPDHRLSCR